MMKERRKSLGISNSRTVEASLRPEASPRSPIRTTMILIPLRDLFRIPLQSLILPRQDRPVPVSVLPLALLLKLALPVQLPARALVASPLEPTLAQVPALGQGPRPPLDQARVPTPTQAL